MLNMISMGMLGMMPTDDHGHVGHAAYVNKQVTFTVWKTISKMAQQREVPKHQMSIHSSLWKIKTKLN